MQKKNYLSSIFLLKLYGKTYFNKATFLLQNISLTWSYINYISFIKCIKDQVKKKPVEFRTVWSSPDIPRGQKQSCCEKTQLHLVPSVKYNILLLGKRALCITFG